MTTPKPMKRDELPPCPHGTVLDGIDPKQWGLCLESVGAFFYPCHLGQLKEIIAWLEQANGLSSRPAIATNAIAPHEGESGQERWDRLVAKATRQPAPIAPGELPTIYYAEDSGFGITLTTDRENIEKLQDPEFPYTRVVAYPPPLDATKLRALLDTELGAMLDSEMTDTLTRPERIRIARDRILSALGLAKETT